jgi:4-hydroxy-3-polyprenylbenzoate decarboxylase
MTRRIVVGVSGASGAPYAHRLLAVLHAGREQWGVEVDLVFSKPGRMVYADETAHDPREWDWPIWGPMDMTAPFASGSAQYEAMVVIPCSAGTLGRVAHGTSMNLLSRAAEVMLKERRKLIMVLRESPYSLIHLKNMVALTEAGALILPASPSFYSAPKDREALLDTVVMRVLDHLDLDSTLIPRWSGRKAGGL